MKRTEISIKLNEIMKIINKLPSWEYDKNMDTFNLSKKGDIIMKSQLNKKIKEWIKFKAN